MRSHRSQRILIKTTAFLLLFGVAGLSTLAKQGKYLPKSSPLRHYAKATKMEQVHHPVDFFPVPAQPASRILPPQPEFSTTPLVWLGLALRPTGLTISFENRAPPSSLAVSFRETFHPVDWK
jgi:hypothetical protein